MKRRGQNFCVTLLLPPGKFDFQVYRNGLPASKTMHTLRYFLLSPAQFTELENVSSKQSLIIKTGTAQGHGLVLTAVSRGPCSLRRWF